VILNLTGQGRAAASRAAAWPAATLDAVGELDQAEKAAVLRALMKLIRSLQERREIAPSRICVTCRHFRPHVHADPKAPHHCTFVNAPFGDGELRTDCAEHQPAPVEQARLAWQRFAKGAGTSAQASEGRP
jgi:hypothetical protein